MEKKFEFSQTNWSFPFITDWREWERALRREIINSPIYKWTLWIKKYLTRDTCEKGALFGSL